VPGPPCSGQLQAASGTAWRDLARKAEGYGLRSFWKGPDDPNYGLLRLDPWRVELWSVKGLFSRTPPQVWRNQA